MDENSVERRYYLRVRTMVNLQKPLSHGFWIKRNSSQSTWVEFKYERLSDFCYRCGRIEHEEKSCSYLVAMIGRGRVYGKWLRAPTLEEIQDRSNSITLSPLRSMGNGESQDAGDRRIGGEEGRGDQARVDEVGKDLDSYVMFIKQFYDVDGTRQLVSGSKKPRGHDQSTSDADRIQTSQRILHHTRKESQCEPLYPPDKIPSNQITQSQREDFNPLNKPDKIQNPLSSLTNSLTNQTSNQLTQMDCSVNSTNSIPSDLTYLQPNKAQQPKNQVFFTNSANQKSIICNPVQVAEWAISKAFDNLSLKRFWTEEQPEMGHKKIRPHAQLHLIKKAQQSSQLISLLLRRLM